MRSLTRYLHCKPSAIPWQSRLSIAIKRQQQLRVLMWLVHAHNGYILMLTDRTYERPVRRLLKIIKHKLGVFRRTNVQYVLIYSEFFIMHGMRAARLFIPAT